MSRLVDDNDMSLAQTAEMDQLVDLAVDYLLRHLRRDDHWPTPTEIKTYRAGFRTAAMLCAAGDIDVIVGVRDAFIQEQNEYQPEGL